MEQRHRPNLQTDMVSDDGMARLVYGDMGFGAGQEWWGEHQWRLQGRDWHANDARFSLPAAIFSYSPHFDGQTRR